MRLDRGRILVAPDSFKGTLSAAEAALAIGRGVRRALPRASVRLHPVSDGGEGFIDALIPFMGGTPVRTEVQGPLPGHRVRARWALVGKGTTAVIEMASAAGLTLVPPGKRDPRVTTTFGVGELIRSALKRNVGSILVGIGGSATNDGGAGMAAALGVKFLDSSGATLKQGGGSLADLARIDISGLDPRLAQTAITVACDVTNSLTGPDGASRIFGPQKGGDPAAVAALDRALRRYAEVLRTDLALDVETIPGSGAGGGLGAGLIAFCNARLASGIDVVLDVTGFDDALASSDLVLTGEGRIDAQTRSGKALSGILRRAQARHVPVAAVVGSFEGAEGDYVGGDGFVALAALDDGSAPPGAAMKNAARVLEERTHKMLLTLIAWES
ncbi:MAG TPA: glycerate kinase [Bacteroidota bacterium]